MEKLSRFRNHVVFSARCKSEDVIPPSLQIRSPVDTDRGKEIAARESRQFLNERLRVSNFRLRQLEDERKWREISLKRALSAVDHTKVIKMSKDHAEKNVPSSEGRAAKEN